jgi:hypothetical protein
MCLANSDAGRLSAGAFVANRPMSMRSPATDEAAYIEVSCTLALVPTISSRHPGADEYANRREVPPRRRR